MRGGKIAAAALRALFLTLVEARADATSESNARESEMKLPEVTILSTLVANFLGVGEWDL